MKRKSLLDTFSSLDQHKKETLADIESPLLLAFATLDIAKKECGITQLSAEHITACLECAGVFIKKKSILGALARAQSRVSITKKDELLYRLMTKGEREVDGIFKSGLLSVVHIKSNQPRTARLKLGQILSSLSGDIRICDPYYGIRTLDELDYISKSRKVKFLTARTSETGRKLSGAIKDFKAERPQFEFRLAANPKVLHDRYVVTRDILLILGHGLKDIGGKESFVVRLNKNLVPDLIKDVTASFDKSWKVATLL
jgi:hypothetical protein